MAVALVTGSSSGTSTSQATGESNAVSVGSSSGSVTVSAMGSSRAISNGTVVGQGNVTAFKFVRRVPISYSTITINASQKSRIRAYT